VDDKNPYQTPAARVDDLKSEQFGRVRILSAEGRIGRLRYIGYTTAIGVVAAIALPAYQDYVHRAQ
jgi:hypothetical protein